MKHDPFFFFATFIYIKPKGGGLPFRFVLRRPQRRLLRWLEEHRPTQARRLVFMSGMPHPDQQRPTRHRPTIKKPFNLAEVRQVVLEVASSARPLPATDRDDTESHTA